MRLTRISRAAVIGVAAALALSSCAANEGGGGGTDVSASGSDLSGDLVGIGATSQSAAQESWIAAFQSANDGVDITYDGAGSGAGRDAFIAGGADFAGSDRALNDEEEAAGGYGGCVDGSGVVELPLYISPIAIVFNLDGIDSLDLDAATVAGIFAGQITSWDDPAIAALNPDATLPATAITAVHRSDNSGTTENFTDYLHQVAPDVWTEEASGDWPTALGGEAAQGTSGVIDAVTNGTGTIGYADASRAGDLGTVSIQVGDEFVAYSADAAAAIVDESPFVEGREDYDLAIELNRTSEEAGVYPIVLVSYLLACQEYTDADTSALVKAYLGYIASPDGQAAAAEAAGSAPISDTLYDRVETAIDAIS